MNEEWFAEARSVLPNELTMDEVIDCIKECGLAKPPAAQNLSGVLAAFVERQNQKSAEQRAAEWIVSAYASAAQTTISRLVPGVSAKYRGTGDRLSLGQTAWRHLQFDHSRQSDWWSASLRQRLLIKKEREWIGHSGQHWWADFWFECEPFLELLRNTLLSDACPTATTVPAPDQEPPDDWTVKRLTFNEDQRRRGDTYMGVLHECVALLNERPKDAPLLRPENIAKLVMGRAGVKQSGLHFPTIKKMLLGKYEPMKKLGVRFPRELYDYLRGGLEAPD